MPPLCSGHRKWYFLLNTISNVVKSLIVIIIIASFMELILPKNKFQPYIKLVVGLVIIVSVLNPLLKLFRIVPDLEMEILRSQVRLYEDESYVDGHVIRQTQSLVAKEYKRRIQGEIGKVIGRYSGVEIIGIDLEIVEEIEKDDFGKILSMKIALKPTDEEKENDGIFIDSVVIQVGGEGVPERDNEELSERYVSQIDDIGREISSYFSLEKDSIELFMVN